MFERKKITYEISELTPYINWVYFHYAWQLRDKQEQAKLKKEAEALLKELEGQYHAHALCIVADANSDGDDIIIGGKRLPMLRQQVADHSMPNLCLADFIRPAEHGIADTAGVFATTVDIGLETDFDSDDYMKMMMQLLADRLAEAAAEKMHEYVRKELWGYAADENLSISELHSEHFQGIRPAVGYPSLPDTSLNFVIADMLGIRDIGIRLTESGAMKPHASVSGLMISHPKARYFSIGEIGEDQLRDYALRRGIPVEVMRKFLLSNLR